MFSNMLMSNKTVASPPPGFDYAAYAGYALHWDVSAMTPVADGAPLAAITDLSGAGNNGTSAGSRNPLYKAATQNGLPVMRLDGVNDDMIMTTPISTIRTVFWVLNCDPVATGFRTVLGNTAISTDFFRGSANYLWHNNPSVSSNNILNGVTKIDGAVVNGIVTPPPTGQFGVISLVTSGNTTANNFGSERNVPGRYFWGDLAELVIYTSALSTADVATVEAHLKAKWGTP